jgi:hypothetical protein
MYFTSKNHRTYERKMLTVEKTKHIKRKKWYKLIRFVVEKKNCKSSVRKMLDTFISKILG